MHNQIECLISVVSAFVDYNKLRWNSQKCFILMFCVLQWHGETPPSVRNKCTWLSTLTCCASEPWHKPLSCFTSSLPARCQNPLSVWSDALFGMRCTMAPIQGARALAKTCAAHTSEKSVRWEIIILFLPWFHLCHHPALAGTVHVHCPLWADLKFQAMFPFKLWYSDLSFAKPWSWKSAHTVLL